MKYGHGFIAAGSLGIVAALGANPASGSPPLHEVLTECRARGSNDGCEKMVECPLGTTLRAATAACNLEHGPVTDEQLSSVKRGYLEVVRPSDQVDEGKCWLANNQIERGRSAIAAIAGQRGVSLGCQEHDRNGGDCQIRATLYCQ